MLFREVGWKNFERLGPIFYHLQTQLFGPNNWNLIWLCLMTAVIVGHRILVRPPAVFLFLNVGLVLIAYFGVYLFTPYSLLAYDVKWHLRTSASRLLLHVLPQATLLIALVFERRKGDLEFQR
jgi:hypothetical protein